ncbi:MAG: GNAT family N-acetyltransferase [Bacilli bacterium]
MYIETERLIINEIQKEDKENYFINISHDKEVLKTFICTYQEKIEDFNFERYLGRSDLFAIREKESKKLIGIFVECEVNKQNKALEIGYGLGSRYWGKGYMTEVVKAMLSYYLNEAGYTTVYASFFEENIASKRVMEKCDMEYSHTCYKELEYLGKERNLIYYKISKEELINN